LKKDFRINFRWVELLNHMKIVEISWTPVAHTCNSSYSGGRDQEARGSKPAPANSLRDPISKKKKKKSQKRAGGVVEGEGPEFKPQYNKNKTKHTKKGRLKTQKP
jgi:hypothetical protein